MIFLTVFTICGSSSHATKTEKWIQRNENRKEKNNFVLYCIIRKTTFSSNFGKNRLTLGWI